MILTKVGNYTEEIYSKKYTVPLTDFQGDVWEVIACGIDEITSEIDEVQTEEVVRILGINAPLKRPGGRIDMLIGSDYCGLEPQVVKTFDNLQLMKN